MRRKALALAVLILIALAPVAAVPAAEADDEDFAEVLDDLDEDERGLRDQLQPGPATAAPPAPSTPKPRLKSKWQRPGDASTAGLVERARWWVLQRTSFSLATRTT